MMARETAATKAERYLTAGRVIVRRVDADVIESTIRGDSGVEWSCGWSPSSGWWCSCPSPSLECAHLRALRLVCVIPRARVEGDPFAGVTA